MIRSAYRALVLEDDKGNNGDFPEGVLPILYDIWILGDGTGHPIIRKARCLGRRKQNPVDMSVAMVFFLIFKFLDSRLARCQPVVWSGGPAPHTLSIK